MLISKNIYPIIHFIYLFCFALTWSNIVLCIVLFSKLHRTFLNYWNFRRIMGSSTMIRGNPRTFHSYVRELKDVQLSSNKAEQKYRNLKYTQLKQQYNSLCEQLSVTVNVMNDCAKQAASIKVMLKQNCDISKDAEH